MSIAFLPNLAGPDGILILLIVLLLFGAKKLPGHTNSSEEKLMRLFGEVRRSSSEYRTDWPLISLLLLNFFIFIAIIFSGNF